MEHPSLRFLVFFVNKLVDLISHLSLSLGNNGCHGWPAFSKNTPKSACSWTFPTVSARTPPRGTTWLFVIVIRCRTRPIKGTFATHNSEALREAALAHLGIALLPDISAQAALGEGSLVQLLEHWQLKGAFSDEINLVRPYSPQIPRAVTALVAHLNDQFSQGFQCQR
ncbi:hypothetical protein AO263_22800 [Pseudomonas sp. NZIPFR-PS5]|nr:hypothetical protein AO263_22800 [Pseudomonas sp. NZIPFR-PS5]